MHALSLSDDMSKLAVAASKYTANAGTADPLLGIEYTYLFVVDA